MFHRRFSSIEFLDSDSPHVERTGAWLKCKVNIPERKRTQWVLTKEEIKNCVWLKPQTVAQIEFTEWTPDPR
jgi:hypothetical protein